MISPKIAFSKDFMEAYSKLPRKIQKKVREFTEKLQKNPTQSGINFERIEDACDPKARSTRIDQAYRTIIVHPPKGDVYLCVWVDHHDDAYQWARNRRFEINPLSGTFQIFMLGDCVQAASPVEPTSPESTAGLFAGFDDEDILLAGVPGPLLASIHALKTDDDLDALAPHLPVDAAEVLYLLAAGYNLLEAIEETDRARPAPQVVDVEDFDAALVRPESQHSFTVLHDADDLETILDAPLEQWRIFLHPSQRKLVKMNANGPVRVLGGAGTGKTVVLLHRANYLASKSFVEKNDRLLVTTFTRNLALDLRMNLKNLCSAETFSRLEITSLHSWAVGFMRKQGHSFRIAPDHERRRLFETAMTEAPDQSIPLAFYMDEWDQVVQAQEISTRDDYFTARRVGRGVRLTRRQRAEVWEVLSRYRSLLNSNGWVEWPDVIRETRLYIEKQNITSPYRGVLSDEAQDFSMSDLRLLRALAPQKPNTLFLVGDGHQRIYGQPVKLSSCGIEIRGRARRLKLNYRTTEQIRNRAIAILENKQIDDLDGGHDTLKGYRSLRNGPDPEVHLFKNEAEEAACIIDKVKGWLASGVTGKSICIAARTRSQISTRYESILNSNDIETIKVETDPEKESQYPGVRLATMHRMKGLEFSRVILAGVQEGHIPLIENREGGNDEDDRHDLNERCLFYVACTRARDELVVSGFGRRSPYLKNN